MMMMIQNQLLPLSLLLAITPFQAHARISSKTLQLVAAINTEQSMPVLNFRDQVGLAQCYPTLKILLNSPAVHNPTPERRELDTEVDNCYLLKDHNERVFEAFERQYPHFKERLQKATDLQKLFGKSEKFEQFFKAFLVLHDSGKPTGPLVNQHENTIPIMQAYLKKWHFNEQQIALATTLIDDDLVGDIVLKGLTVNDAQKRIQKEATELRLSKETVCILHHFFWACDAGSYKSLAECIVTDNNGISLPRYHQKTIKDLYARCNQNKH